MRIQLGRISMWLLGVVCLCVWALYIAWSRAVLSLSALYSGRASDVAYHADLE